MGLGYNGIMENKMETTIMENQMEKKMENEMETREYIGVILGLLRLVTQSLSTVVEVSQSACLDFVVALTAGR